MQKLQATAKSPSTCLVDKISTTISFSSLKEQNKNKKKTTKKKQKKTPTKNNRA